MSTMKCCAGSRIWCRNVPSGSFVSAADAAAAKTLQPHRSLGQHPQEVNTFVRQPIIFNGSSICSGDNWFSLCLCTLVTFNFCHPICICHVLKERSATAAARTLYSGASATAATAAAAREAEPQSWTVAANQEDSTRGCCFFFALLIQIYQRHHPLSNVQPGLLLVGHFHPNQS